MPNPSLSLILPLHATANQAEIALESLCPPYQEQVGDAVEILVVEAPSEDMLREDRARAGRQQVRYVPFDGVTAHRTRSLEIGIRESRAPVVGLFMDGAHWVTPRALETALRALRLGDAPLVALPEYRLDGSLVDGAGTVQGEQAFLERANWRKKPYDLFSSARFGPANPNGFLGPLLGAGCLFAPKDAFQRLMPFPALYDVPGAAALKLWIYTELARLPGTLLVVLVGEGALRQHYPELDAPRVTHEERSVQDLVISAASAIPDFRAIHREPLAFGMAPGPALRFVAESAAIAEFHCAACRGRGEPPWFTDPA